MRMLVKLYSDDVNCLQRYLAPDSSLIERLKSSWRLTANALPNDLSANATICTEVNYLLSLKLYRELVQAPLNG